LLGLERLVRAVGGNIEGNAALCLADRPRLDTLTDDDFFVAQVSGQRFRDLGLACRQNGNDVDHRDADARTGEHLAELAPDITAADHKERFREPFELERARAGEMRHTLNARNLRQRRRRAGRDNDLASFCELSVYRDTAICQPCPALNISDRIVVREQVEILRLPEPRDQFVLLADNGTPILDAPMGTDSHEPRCGVGMMGRLRLPDQVLRWNTADVDAGAAAQIGSCSAVSIAGNISAAQAFLNI
jgi:hypothetical protein